MLPLARSRRSTLVAALAMSGCGADTVAPALSERLAEALASVA